MHKLFLAFALASALLPLGGCQTIRSVDQAVALANQNVGDYTVLDEKSWYYAESLYDVPSAAYLSVNSRGLFVGHEALKATLKADLQKLNALRQGVYQAYKTGNAAAFRDKITQLKALSDQVRNLIPQ
jgi:hypothetical protein